MRRFSAKLLGLCMTYIFLNMGCTSSIGTHFFLLDYGSCVMLRIGDSARLPGKSDLVTFLDVPSDSRCPRDAQCIWAGEVITLFRLDHQNASTLFKLTLGPDASKALFQTGPYVFRLNKVLPYPRVSQSIPRADYRAEICLTRS